MNLERSSTLTGLAYGLPFLVWCLPGLHQGIEAGAAPQVLANAMMVLWCLQAIMVALFVPRFLRHADWLQALACALLLVAVPWPFLALAWLGGGVSATVLCLSQGGMLVLAALLLSGARTLSRWGRPAGVGQRLSLSVLQLVAVGLILHYRSGWLEWLA